MIKCSPHLGDVIKAVKILKPVDDNAYEKILNAFGLTYSIIEEKTETSAKPEIKEEPVQPPIKETEDQQLEKRESVNQKKPEVSRGEEIQLQIDDITDDSPDFSVKSSPPAYLNDPGIEPIPGESETKIAELVPLIDHQHRRMRIWDISTRLLPVGEINIRELIDTLSRLEFPGQFPRYNKQTLKRGFHLLIDKSESMINFKQDQNLIYYEMEKTIGSGIFDTYFFKETPRDLVYTSHSVEERPYPVPFNQLLIILSDPENFTPGNKSSYYRKWQEFITIALERKCAIKLISPYPAFVPHVRNNNIEVLEWEQQQQGRKHHDPLQGIEQYKKDDKLFNSINNDVFKLAVAVSLSLRIDKELIRMIRRQFFPSFCPGTEKGLWFSSLVESRSNLSIVFYPAARKALRHILSKADPVFINNIYEFISRYNGKINSSPVLSIELKMAFYALDAGGNEDEINTLSKRIIYSVIKEKRFKLGNYISSFVEAMPDSFRELTIIKELSAILNLAAGRIEIDDSSSIALKPYRWVIDMLPCIEAGVSMNGTQLQFSYPPETNSIRITLPATNPLVIRLKRDTGTDEIIRLEKNKPLFIDNIHLPVTIETLDSIKRIAALITHDDLEVIKEIEKKLRMKFGKYNSLDYKGRGYVLNPNNRVKGIGFFECFIKDINVFIKELMKLDQLTELKFYSNILKDISPLSILTRLKHLDLYINKIEEITPLSKLTELRELRLHSNLITDISPLKDLNKLEEVELHGNSISDITPLRNLTKIHSLNLSHNNIETISALANLKALKWLDLSDNRIEDLSPLRELTNLESLILHNNKITDLTPLEGLGKLKELGINNNPLSKPPLDVAEQGIYSIMKWMGKSTPLKAFPAGKEIKTTWILHISDLQCKTGFYKKESHIYVSFIERLKRDYRENNIKPEIIVISGDIAFQGLAEEYRVAKECLDDIKNIFELGDENIFIVPGNHDINRRLYKTDYLPDISEMNDINAKLQDKKKRDELFRGMDPYFDFIKRNYPYLQPIDENLVPFVYRYKSLSNKKIALVGYNSAWLSYRYNSKEIIAIGEYQVQKANEKLKKYDNIDLVINIFHHPIDHLWPPDEKVCTGAFKNTICLVGHQHIMTDTVLNIGNDRIVQLQTGGNFHKSHYSWPSQFQYITFDWENMKIETDCREYSEETGIWECSIQQEGNYSC